MYRHFKHTVTTKRLERDGNKQIYSDHLTDLKGYVATVSPSRNNSGLDRLNIQYQFFTSYSADVAAGDIIVHKGREFHVRSALLQEGIRLKHLQCDLELKNG